MSRPKLDFETSVDSYFLSKGVEIIDLDKIDQSKFTTNTFFSIQCKQNPEHKYSLSITMIRNEGKDATVCPHCTRAKAYKETGIPLSKMEAYCTKNNLKILNIQDFYNKWDDQLHTECIKCNSLYDIKSLNYFYETNLEKPYHCEKCRRVCLGLVDAENLNTILTERLNQAPDPVVLLSTKPSDKIMSPMLSEKFVESSWHIVEYIGTKEEGTFQCKDCGSTKMCSPHSLFIGRGGGCKNCNLQIQSKNIEVKILDKCKENNIYPLKNRFYKNLDSPIDFKCNSCGINFIRSWSDVNYGHGVLNCPACGPRINHQQREVSKFIESIVNEPIKENDRVVIKPLEIDILYNNIGIEYCGSIWHSTKYEKYANNTNSHAEKHQLALDKGIRLVTMFDDEWLLNKDLVKSRLRVIFGKIENKIYARKCEVRFIENKTALDFCAVHHIQGKGHAHSAYGLYYNNELISVMSMSLPSVSKGGNKKNYDYELNRFCTKMDYIVVGGANKLFSAFKKLYVGKKIITFCDLRWNTGGTYLKMGFVQTGTSRPNYYYFGKDTGYERKHRFGFTKEKLLSKYPGSYGDMSEREIAEKNALYQIHDCGHMRFEIVA